MVTVYTRPGCMPCALTKRHLARLGVAYVEEPITPGVLSELAELGHHTAPIVTVGGDHWSGYRPDRLDALARVPSSGSAS